MGYIERPETASPARTVKSCKLIRRVYRTVYVATMTQVQVKIPEGLVEKIDEWIREVRFSSRSEAIRTILALYEEKERTREFYAMIHSRAEEVRRSPELLVHLEEAS